MNDVTTQAPSATVSGCQVTVSAPFTGDGNDTSRTKVEYWDDERSIGNAIIVTLCRGWRFAVQDVEHVRGFDTVGHRVIRRGGRSWRGIQL